MYLSVNCIEWYICIFGTFFPSTYISSMLIFITEALALLKSLPCFNSATMSAAVQISFSNSAKLLINFFCNFSSTFTMTLTLTFARFIIIITFQMKFTGFKNLIQCFWNQRSIVTAIIV